VAQLAAAQDLKEAIEERDYLDRILMPVQIAEAQKLAENGSKNPSLNNSD